MIEFNDSVRDALGGRHLTAADADILEQGLRRPEGQTQTATGVFHYESNVRRSSTRQMCTY